MTRSTADQCQCYVMFNEQDDLLGKLLCNLIGSLRQSDAYMRQ